MNPTVRLGLAASLCLLGATPLVAQDTGRFDLGVRGVLSVADGEPANDIPGAGLFGRYRLGEHWRLGVAVDRTEYDFEQPARLLGLRQDPAAEPIDSLAEATVVSLWMERTRGGDRAWDWWWGGGLGFASVDVPAVAGRLASGGRFDIHTEADTEVIASLLAGVDRRLGRRLVLTFALRADQHFADWRVEDRVSGARASVDDYLALGGSLGLAVRF